MKKGNIPPPASGKPVDVLYFRNHFPFQRVQIEILIQINARRGFNHFALDESGQIFRRYVFVLWRHGMSSFLQ